jgi:hypothetical protein
MNKRQLKNDEPFFDDCPICQAMKKMGIRPMRVDREGKILVTPIHPKLVEALKPAFLEARRQGGIAGGSMFETEE